MPRPFDQSLALLVFIACGSVVSLPVAAAEDEQITLEQIRAKVSQWRASFVNVRVVYDLRSLPPSDEPVVDWPSPPDDPELAPRFRQTEWIWADHGLDLMDIRSFYWTPGKTGHRTIDVFNGPKGVAFRASYQKSREEAEVLKELRLQGLGVGKPISWRNRTAMLGLYWPDTVEWLPEILSKWDWKLEAIEPILGQPCARIAAHYAVGAETNVDVLWLDLNHDCLPRRYRLLPNSRRKFGLDFVIDEFQQLKGGLWFPKRERLQLQTKPIENQLIVVTEAAVNETLDLGRFDPPQPENGTAVSDGLTGKNYRHGQQTTSHEQVVKPIAPNPTAQPPSAVPPASWGTGLVVTMICVSFAFLAIGLWTRKKE